MNREELLGPVVSPETGKAYEPGTGYKGVGIGVGIVVLLAMKMCHSVFTGDVGSDRLSTADLPSQIAAGVAQVRSQLPIRVDEITTMTAISAAGTQVLYDMRLDIDIEATDLAAASAEQQAYADRAACEERDTRRLIEAGAALTYRYTDRNGDQFQTRIESCAGAQSAAARVPNR